MILDTEKLIIDLKSLSRGMNRDSFVIPLDRIDLDLEDIKANDDSGILDLALDLQDETVFCTGNLKAVFSTPCARCLEPALFSVSEPIQREYTWNSDPSENQERVVISRTGELDILGAVREAVLLSIPGKPLCSPDCPGICYN